MSTQITNILLIGKSYGDYLNGSILAYKHLADNSHQLDFIDGTNLSLKNFQSFFSTYKRIILCHQNHTNYGFHIPIEYFFNKQFSYYTRLQNIALYPYSITNGFSIYKNWKKHKNFIPTITGEYSENVYSDECYGYYYRKKASIDGFYYLLDTIKNRAIKLYFCGDIPDYQYIKQKCPNVICYHTTDMVTFFNNISHYIVTMSSRFIDPFPHTLLEAVQHNKQIIALKLSNRSHTDGIDDILSIVKYHINFDKKICKNDSCLNFSTFKKFYELVIDNNYQYYIDYNKYPSFYDWCSHEL